MRVVPWTVSLGLGFIAVAAFAPGPARAEDGVKRTEAKVHKARGDALAAKGQNDAALGAYRQAIATDADYFDAYEDIGITLFEMSRYEDAIAAFKNALKKRPTYHRGYYNIAYAERKLSKHKDASTNYRKFLELVPGDPDGFYGLAESLKGLSDRKGAIQNYERYVEVEKRPEEKKWVEKAKAEIARLKAEEGKAQGAAAAPGAPKGAAGASGTAGTTVAATVAATSVSTVPPAESREQRMSKGLAKTGKEYLGKKAYDFALFSFRDALRADDANWEAHYQLGLTLALLGHPAKAMAHFRRVLELQPDHADAKAKLTPR